MDRVLPTPDAEMEAAAQELGLVAGFAVQRDDRAAADGAFCGPEFLDHADGIIGNVANRQPPDEEHGEESAETPHEDRRDRLKEIDELLREIAPSSLPILRLSRVGSLE